MLLGGYVVFNAAFAFGPVMLYDIPEWVSFFPPGIQDVTETRESFQDRERGFLAVLRTDPPRTKSLLNNHPEMLEWIESLDTQVVVLTNEGQSLLFVPYPFVVTTHPWLSQDIDGETCNSRMRVAFVVFDWYWYKTKDLQNKIEQECPDFSRQYFDHSTVYLSRYFEVSLGAIP
jgi:hypothetical protein